MSFAITPCCYFSKNLFGNVNNDYIDCSLVNDLGYWYTKYTMKCGVKNHQPDNISHSLIGLEHTYYVELENFTCKVKFILSPLKDDDFNKYTYCRV